jgi:hypothetical protein
MEDHMLRTINLEGTLSMESIHININKIEDIDAIVLKASMTQFE